MNIDTIENASRRAFLQTGIAAGAGLLLGLRIGPQGDALAGMLEAGPGRGGRGQDAPPAPSSPMPSCASARTTPSP